jgi:hypothetical protein
MDSGIFINIIITGVVGLSILGLVVCGVILYECQQEDMTYWSDEEDSTDSKEDSSNTV